MRKPEADLEDPLCGFVRRQLDDIQLIRRRYGWFLHTLSAGQPFEKKKGQRKSPLARQITDQLLEPFVSGVSLGEDFQVDAPQVNIQYAVLEREGREPELVERMYFARLLDFLYFSPSSAPTAAGGSFRSRELPIITVTNLFRAGETKPAGRSAPPPVFRTRCTTTRFGNCTSGPIRNTLLAPGRAP